LRFDVDDGGELYDSLLEPMRQYDSRIGVAFVVIRAALWNSGFDESIWRNEITMGYVIDRLRFLATYR
jgi:hypothetical protein